VLKRKKGEFCLGGAAVYIGETRVEPLGSKKKVKASEGGGACCMHKNKP
jgi:hypothetical protein